MTAIGFVALSVWLFVQAASAFTCPGGSFGAIWAVHSEGDAALLLDVHTTEVSN